MRSKVQSLASLSGQGLSIAMSCGVVCRRGSDLVLLWLWRRPVATAPDLTPSLEPPYAMNAALKKKKKKKTKKNCKL